ncbi:MAG: DNA-3-methyladenine glycosylase 2 family protein [Pseudomonadota bacterium]
MRVIETDLDVAEGAAWLGQREPKFAEALARVGPLPLRRRPDGFAGLMDIILGQQVSTASALALRKRLQAAGLFDQAAVRVADDAALRAVGLSKPKARYARHLAQAELDFDALRAMPDDAVFEQLTALTGVGPWTAQIYLMFCLGRADAFAPGDLALQVAAQALFDLPERPTPTQLDKMAEAWSPWRSVAARALFAYYRLVKAREGLT